MTLEEKDLLIKDLCSRLPYGVKFPVTVKNPITLEPIETIGTISSINEYGIVSFVWDYEGQEILVKNSLYIKDVKPYLFPISSMTKEQEKEYDKAYMKDMEAVRNNLLKFAKGESILDGAIMYHHVDWLNKNNFDYRGLIPMGLAENASNKNIY